MLSLGGCSPLSSHKYDVPSAKGKCGGDCHHVALPKLWSGGGSPTPPPLPNRM